MPKVGKDKSYRQKNLAFMRWLKSELYEQGITQKELAEEIGITQQALTYHFTKKAPFDYPQLIGIFNMLDVPGEKIADLLRTKGR